MPKTILGAIIGGGFIAGLIDIVYACAYTFYLGSGAPPEAVLQYVASGWVGIEAARAGGAEMAALGLLSHFLIVIVMAAIYVIASRFIAVLRTQPLVYGAAYGLALWLAMNFIVVPLSNAPDPRFPLWPTFTGILVHMFAVGMVIALFASNVRPRETSQPAP